jgi:hypothetical protein
MKTRAAKSNLSLSTTVQKGRVFAEFATGGMKMSIQYSDRYHSVKAQRFAEVK